MINFEDQVNVSLCRKVIKLLEFYFAKVLLCFAQTMSLKLMFIVEPRNTVMMIASDQILKIVNFYGTPQRLILTCEFHDHSRQNLYIDWTVSPLTDHCLQWNKCYCFHIHLNLLTDMEPLMTFLFCWWTVVCFCGLSLPAVYAVSIWYGIT